MPPSVIVIVNFSFDKFLQFLKGFQLGNLLFPFILEPAEKGLLAGVVGWRPRIRVRQPAKLQPGFNILVAGILTKAWD